MEEEKKESADNIEQSSPQPTHERLEIRITTKPTPTLGPVSKSQGALTEKQRKALKKKKKKKLKSIGRKHPEFELTYDMMLGIRYAVSLSEPSATTTHTHTHTQTQTQTGTAHTITNTTNTHTATAAYNTSTNASLSSVPTPHSQHSHTLPHLLMPNRHSFTKSSTTTSLTDYPSSDDESDSDDNHQLEAEFVEARKYKFPAEGSERTPAHEMSDFKFKDYCPQIFRQLREWFRISTQEYLVTICGDFKLLEFISNSKSGQFFFFSHNSQFIIKTMTRTESIFLRKILPSYYRYVSQQPDTLLPKFFGMHRVKRKKQKIYFLIQQNVFFSDVDDIHDQYDLKGSTQGRRATKAERKKGAILKDLDWVDEGKKLKIGRERAKLFKDQLKRDTQWLRTEKIMDYSLLVGIHYLHRARSPDRKRKHKLNGGNHSPNDHNIVLDHSSNEHKYEPELQTVEEDQEDGANSSGNQTNDTNDDPNLQEMSSLKLGALSTVSSYNDLHQTEITPFHPHSNDVEEEEEEEEEEDAVPQGTHESSDHVNAHEHNLHAANPASNDTENVELIASPPSKLKIKVTPTLHPTSPPPNADIDALPHDENSNHNTPQRNALDYMLKPSTTEYTYTGTSDECDLNPPNPGSHNIDECGLIVDADEELETEHKIRSRSADIRNEPMQLQYNGDFLHDGNIYIPHRRSSAPTIVSPDYHSPGSHDNRNGKLFSFRGSPSTTPSTPTEVVLSPKDTQRRKSRHRDKKDTHIHSQSLQANEFTQVVSQLHIKTDNRLTLRPSNSDRGNPGITRTLSAKTSPVYRGHISVKHPKRYKRKTAAEMQFAPEDIHLPAGIKLEVLEEKQNANAHSVHAHEANVSDTEPHPVLQGANTYPKANEPESAEQRPEMQLSSSMPSMQSNAAPNALNTNPAELTNSDHLLDGDEQLNPAEATTASTDICPWTTFHGGMVEEDELGAMGNEVYFVGLIDILQKYNKRKKLENWIKKMKYDKHAISAAPPDLYAQRMCDFFEDKVV